MELVQPFVKELLETDDLAKAKSLAIEFQNSVTKSSLVSEDKILLLSLGTSIQVLAENSDELVEAIASQIEATTGNARMIGGCKLDWRNIWASAVIGGTITGTGAAYVAATVGTAVLPVIGTVTGGVSAGIGGFAVGFVGGAAAAVASELLTSCFR